MSFNWKAWKGTKWFCSVERDFCIEATHNCISFVSLKILLSSATATGVESELKISMNIERRELKNIANLVESHLGKTNQNP
jgi:hypothetical protein